MKPRPGDFAVVDTRKRTPGLTQLGKALSRGGFTLFDHAVICSRVDRDGTIHIVEAMRAGAKENVWHYDDHDHLWSTGVVKTSPNAGKAALAYVDTPYSWRDYAAIAAHASGLWVPGLRHYLASPSHLIGCQLVERAQRDAGVDLFTDHRWRGYVRPSDLAELILSVGELTVPKGRRTASAANGTRKTDTSTRSRATAPARGTRKTNTPTRSRTTTGANGTRKTDASTRSRAATPANGTRKTNTPTRSRAATPASGTWTMVTGTHKVTPGSGWPSRVPAAASETRTSDTGTRSRTATATNRMRRQRRRWFS